MTTLLAIWQLSLSLSSAALLALALILVARFVAERRDKRTQTERRRIAGMLMAASLDAPVAPKRALEKQVAAQLVLEMAELVRGPDREALLANAEALRIPHTLLRSSVSRSAQERLLAAEALAMFPTGQERVRQMLRDRNPGVRLGSALALAQNQAAPAPAEIVRLLGLGTTERSLLVASLMRDLVDADPASVEDLLRDASLPNAAKLAAVDALASSGLVEHARLVARMAEQARSDDELLPRIYNALGRIGHPSGHAAILRGLAHPAWTVRAAAAQAAGANRLVAAAEPLGALLGDEQWWVRLRAGEALRRLGPQGYEVLTQVAASEHPLARDAAALTLEERRSG